MIRLTVGWSAVAPTRPVAARNPADPAYDWSTTDAAITAARQRGLKVLLSLDGVPRWAEQGKRPRRYLNVNAYRTSPRAAGAFATAVARRYRTKARYLQLFNEPNLALYLAPTWSRGQPVAAQRYRRILNAAYPGVHAAGMQLVTAGTAPYGDPDRNGDRQRPRAFWRVVFKKRVRFDVLAHHPYAVRGPRDGAFSADDIAVPDVHRLSELVADAVRRGTAVPRKRKPVWVTEIGWDSRPPDRHGIPMRTFTRWVADSMFVLWKQRVDHVFWFLVRDQLPVPSFAATRQSGMYFADGRPKPALRAFVFPFSCERAGARTRVWLRAPSSAPVVIEDATGRRLARVFPGSDRVALTTVRGRPRLRAVAGAMRSITCRA